MPKFPLTPVSPRRRKLLASMAGALGAWPLLGRSAQAGTPAGVAGAGPELGPAQLRPGTSQKASSYDRTGGNADAYTIAPGKTLTVLAANGPGIIRHCWFTIAAGPHHLKDLVLRMYWDQETAPSVETPIGDFFGLSLGDYFTYASQAMTVAPMKALNCYLPMPFRSSALVTVTNEGPAPVAAFYANLDYELVPQLPADTLYLHAQYRQAAPCTGWTDDWQSNGDPIVLRQTNLYGEGNYVVMEATGQGQYIGTSLGVLQNQEGWWGEGDDMVFIDTNPGQRVLPTINGTGSEDYFNGAWDFGDRSFAYPFNGAPLVVNPERVGGRWCVYRWHLPDPIRFRQSLRMTLEHGHANARSDNYYSVGYWYQNEPHAAFPALPSALDRHPQLFAVGGPSETPLPAANPNPLP